MLIGSAAVSVLIGTFIASSVEVTEMVIIVVGVGATRGWRSTWIGAGAGLTVLAGIIAGLGQALQLIPIDVVRVIIGALLLTFGLQWYRKGVIQVAADGFSLGTEEEEVDSSGDTSGAIDWTAFVLSFKGVLLEGLEVAFIVVAFGAGGGRGNSGSGSYGAAYVGAAAAFVFIGVIGLIAKRQLERVPGRTLKFGVGGLLSTFGTFWALEGLGVRWPGGDLSLAWLYGLYLASTFGVMYAIRRGSLGPVPSSSFLTRAWPVRTGSLPPARCRSGHFRRLTACKPTAWWVPAPRRRCEQCERSGESRSIRARSGLTPPTETRFSRCRIGSTSSLLAWSTARPAERSACYSIPASWIPSTPAWSLPSSGNTGSPGPDALMSRRAWHWLPF